MVTQLRLVVHWKKIVYDDLLVTISNVSHFKKENGARAICDDSAIAVSQERVGLAPNYLNNRSIDSYAVSAYVYNITNSHGYRRHAAKALLRYGDARAAGASFVVIFIKLREPKKQFIDYKWGERAAHMVLEKCEVDHAMSWLSTLGGAFSALGEQFQHCAEIAGKISVHQFTLALRLRNPLLVARCKLYAALSIIQRGNLRLPKIMIKDIFQFAVEQKDAHLQRMCQGVWAKLKYCYELRKQQRNLLRV